MQVRNTTQAYGWVSIALHWLMALLLFVMFALGVYMVELTYLDAWYKSAPSWHQSVGMLLFMLLVFRLSWRLLNPLPIIYGGNGEKIIALWVHRSHYLLMFAVMFSGYLMVTAGGRSIAVFSWFEVPALLAAEKGREEIAGYAHMLLAWALMGLAALHVLAALKHHIVDKDRTLFRMLGIQGEKK